MTRKFFFVFHPCFIRGQKLSFAWLWLWLAISARAASPAEFEAANKLFEQGKFADAVKAYEALLTNGPTAAVYFNLGNAHFKAGQPGRAIARYHDALQLAPRDPDARANLQFVRKSLGVAADEPLGRHLLRLHTLNEWTWLAGLGLGVWFLLLAVGEAWPARRAGFGGVIKFAGALALALTGLLGAAHWERGATPRAVVVTAEVAVRPGPLLESKPAFSLRDGAEVDVLEAKDAWRLVRDAGQRAGWVPRDALLALP